MRVVFMGTPGFAVPTLAAILAAGHQVVAVYTQPPRPAGRGMLERRSPVHTFAAQHHIRVLTPASLKGEAPQTEFETHNADVVVVVAYGLILPKRVLEAPREGCLNLHASALPRWRGAAPIQRAIMAGDTRTAATVMRMDEGLDTGPICLEEDVAIAPDTTAGELHDALASRGAALLIKALAAVGEGRLTCRPQAEEGVTYAAKIAKDEARIDFGRPAREVHNRIRALSPAPGAWFEFDNAGARERVKVLRATLVDGSGPAGEVLDDALTIACGEGAIRILEVQRGGKKPMPAAAFLRGVPLRRGCAL
jgi:methionyl-tRNA formyltransferase